MTGIGTFLVSLAGPLARKVLTVLGFGLVSYAGMSTLLNTVLGYATSAWSGLPAETLAMLQLSGVHTSLAILSGAMVTRISLLQLKKLQLLA